MSLLDKAKSLFSGGSTADAHDHAGHDHAGHDHDHSHEADATPAPVDADTPMSEPEAGEDTPA